MNLEQQIFYNFLDQEAFKTIQNGTAAFIGNLSFVQILFCAFVAGSIFYFIFRMKKP
jgi:hypothetical protein